MQSNLLGLGLLARGAPVLWIVGLSFLAFLIWLASAWVISENKQHYLNLHDPGAIFAGFMGLVTIVGFAFTLHDLREMRRRITTFPDLAKSLTKMLETAGRRRDTVRFLAYTPALGYIALDDDSFKAFRNKLTNKIDNADNPPVEMVCLSGESLEDWHNLFIGRRTRRTTFGEVGKGVPKQRPAKPGVVDPKMASEATREAEKIVKAILGDEKDAHQAEDEPARVKRLPFEFLPGYYFFVCSDRAIVVAPLQLPFPKGAPKSAQDSRDTVQMLGFETNDRAIIRDLGDLYASYKRLPSSYIAEHSQIIQADKFEKLCDNSFQDAFELLKRQFQIASGAVEPPPGDLRFRTLREDYRGYLEGKLSDTKLEMTFRLSLKEEAPHS